jgi:hypothetical protein
MVAMDTGFTIINTNMFHHPLRIALLLLQQEILY